MTVNDINVTQAIILAAGSNSRLTSVKPFMKPLKVVNGKPLIVHAYEHAQQWRVKQEDIILVASEENVADIIKVSPADCYKRAIQSEPSGAIHALRLGVTRLQHAVGADYTVILCADNTFSPPPFDYIIPEGMCVYFADSGAQTTNPADNRFTRIVLLEDMRHGFYEPYTHEGIAHDGKWCGPLLIPTDVLRHMVGFAESLTDLIRICSLFGRYSVAIEMECDDHGVD